MTRFFREISGFEKAYAEKRRYGLRAGVQADNGQVQADCQGCFERATKFPDIIALVKYRQAYDIPLWCLIPFKADNLRDVRRYISGTHLANAAYSTMPIAWLQGKLRVSALQSHAISQRKVVTQDVQNKLLRLGAILKG